LKYIKEQNWQSSLMLIKVKTLAILRIDKAKDGEIKERVFAKFSFNGIVYELPVTDSNIERRYNAKKPDIYQVRSTENYLCISLGEPHFGNCYKLVAAILSFNPERPDKVEKSEAHIVFDEALFNRLKIWRTKKASEAGLPPYCIAHDRSLREIVEHNVEFIEDLQTVHGFGKVKITKYVKIF